MVETVALQDPINSEAGIVFKGIPNKVNVSRVVTLTGHFTQAIPGGIALGKTENDCWKGTKQ